MELASELSFHIVDLPPEGVEVHGEVPFAALDIQPDAICSFPRPLGYDLTLAPLQDGVLVRGRLYGSLVRVCDRCLDPGEVEIEVPDVCHHLEQVVGTVIDLTELLREDILLVLPQSWVCDAECRGLCPGCGQNLNDAECACAAAARAASDDRESWGALDRLHVQDEG